MMPSRTPHPPHPPHQLRATRTLRRLPPAAPIAALATLAAMAVACTDIGTDPNTPTSIAVSGLPSPSIVIGDTLRDSLGNAAPVRVTLFNSRGDTIRTDVPLTVLIAPRADSSGLTYEAETGFIVSDSAQTRNLRTPTVQLQAGGLTLPTLQLAVVFAPTRMTAPDTISTLVLDVADNTANVSASALNVKLEYDTTTATGVAAARPVPSYLVRFAVGYAATTLADSVRLVDDLGTRRSTMDTTSTAGIAGRRLRVFLRNGARGADSVIVNATALVPGKAALVQSLVLRLRTPATAP
jgi:hypothetical protein